ncbi:hypothetical protein ACH9EU_01680 [Kocuria sp. M1R5S2]
MSGAQRPRQRLTAHDHLPPSPPRCRDAATEWFHEGPAESWEVVAQHLGDQLTTVLHHYVRAGEDALRDSVGKLADL